ncbi:MAG: CotH kinase family protein [Bacteroidaceae bacterium]|nr:CotH kinase family protein [Bacteroidaceae bacterium]
MNKKKFYCLVILLTLVLTGKTDTADCHYIYFTDGSVEAYPQEFVKHVGHNDDTYTLTLINDSTLNWESGTIDSISMMPPTYPKFAAFEFNDKHNEQLYDDVEATLSDDKVRATVGAIGKWLTPSFQLNDPEAVAYVNGKEQTSGISRQRFADSVVYTLAYPNHQLLAMTKVSDEVWNTPEETINEIALSTGMLSTNAPTSMEGEGLDMMLDGNTSTFFHSTWSKDEVYEVDLNKQVYVGVALPKELSYIQFYYTDRTGTTRYNIQEWRIEASADGEQWNTVAILNESNGLPITGNEVTYTSPTIDLGGSYSHLRFVATKVGYKNYLCLSELKLYEVVLSNNTPELIQPARYDFCMMPLGRKATAKVDWLTDHADVPRIDIDIDGGEMVSSKEYYLNAYIRINGNGVWPDMEDSVQIKGRGNTSWNEGKPYAKNPYRLKFAKSVKPFGMKKGKNWNLIAQAQKGSLMTNPMAMKIARMVGTTAANDIVPVDLYMNGEYRGSYIFTQKVGLANNSVDIDERGAVLLELDSYFDDPYKFKSTSFQLPVNFKEPDFAEGETKLTFEQVQADFNLLETAVYNNSHFERLVDVEMLTRFMLVNELVGNVELTHPKSMFLYRENMHHLSSLYTFGPVWDFDWSYGYADKRVYYTSWVTSSPFDYKPSRPNYFFSKLWSASGLITHQYNKLWTDFIENHLQELLDYADDYYAFAANSFSKNAIKWSDSNNNEAQVTNLKAWLAQRAHHIKNQLGPYNGNENAPHPFGDVDNNGTIDSCDLRLMVSHILGETTHGLDEMQADIDADGETTISDVAWLCNLLPSQNENIHYPMGNNEDSGNWIQAEANEQSETLIVSLENSTPFIAFSMRLQLPEGITIAQRVESAKRIAATHTIEHTTASDTDCLIAVFSPDNSFIADSNGPLLNIALKKDSKDGIAEGTIKISDICMVTGNGLLQRLDNVETDIYISDTGIELIPAELCSVTWYSIEGKPLTEPRPGILICRKVYANGRIKVEKILWE